MAGKLVGIEVEQSADTPFVIVTIGLTQVKLNFKQAEKLIALLEQAVDMLYSPPPLRIGDVMFNE